MKVDRSFVPHLGNEAENPNLVKAILALADSLDLEVIAEGIETEKQLQFLQHNGCLLGQGFLFYRPMPAESGRDVIRNLNAAKISESGSLPRERCRMRVTVTCRYISILWLIYVLFSVLHCAIFYRVDFCDRNDRCQRPHRPSH